MSETDVVQLRGNYARARMEWERAKASLLTAKAVFERAQRARAEADRALSERIGSDAEWPDKLALVDAYAKAVRDLEVADAALDKATRYEAETSRIEQTTLKALAGVI